MIRVSSADETKRADITHRLRRYRSTVANYQACKELYDSLYPSGTQTLSDMPMVRSDTYEPERWAQRRWNQRDRMEQSLNEMRDAYEDLERLIDLVTGDYNTVIKRRYALNESWEQIGRKMNFCERQIRRLHERAISRIAESVE